MIIEAPYEAWIKVILSSDATIEDAIKVLNDSGQKIVVVVDALMKLVGTVSDGDIRRGLLRNQSLHNSLDEVINRNPIVTKFGVKHENILNLMDSRKIQQVPIIDENRKMVGLYIWENTHNLRRRDNSFVIMAGGKGTRLLPQTQNFPKPLLEVSGKPMLEHIILRAKKEGFFKFIISVHYLGTMIEDYFGNGEKLDIEIEYLREELPLGTAGALSLLDPHPDQPIVVTNGDVISDIRYGEMLDFHVENHAVATMAVKLYEWQNPFGVVQTNGINVIGYQEKPILFSKINAGVYILSPHAIKNMARNNPIDMPNLFENLQSENERVIAYSIHEEWADIGLPNELLKANSKNTIDTGS